MKHLILATVALMSFASAVPALAQRPQVKLQQLAASGKPGAETNAPSRNSALNDLQGRAQRGTQLAASGLEYVRQSHGQYT
jgi:hypothetical protein